MDKPQIQSTTILNGYCTIPKKIRHLYLMNKTNQKLNGISNLIPRCKNIQTSQVQANLKILFFLPVTKQVSIIGANQVIGNTSVDSNISIGRVRGTI